MELDLNDYSEYRYKSISPFGFAKMLVINLSITPQINQYRVPITSVADPGSLSRIPDPNFFHPGFRIQGPKRHRIRIRTQPIIAPFCVTGCSPLIYVDGIFRSVCGRSSWRVICSARAGPCGRAARSVPLLAVVRVQSVRVHDPEVLENPRVNARIIPVPYNSREQKPGKTPSQLEQWTAGTNY